MGDFVANSRFEINLQIFGLEWHILAEIWSITEVHV